MSGKRILILAIACASFACCAPSLAAAAGTRVDAGTWEAGIILGEPTGFSAKYWTTWQGALDFGSSEYLHVSKARAERLAKKREGARPPGGGR